MPKAALPTNSEVARSLERLQVSGTPPARDSLVAQV
jgi:hypothetical protein